jgi:UDP-N-acetylglucosamine 3-dehydrogenase
MKKKIRTAVIGAGNMGKNHARVYAEISNLVAISDLLPETGKVLSDQYGVRFYQDYREMLDIEKPDAVSVVVPTKFHKEVVLECLARKIPSLVEKPIASTVEEANIMLEAAKKYKTFLMVGHIERFNPAIKKLKQLIDTQRLGKIISLLAIRVGIAPPNIPNSDVVLDLGIHDVDIFNFLLDKFPVNKKVIRDKIFKNNKGDSASILLEYDSAIGYIQTNWITPIKMRKLFVTGTNAFVELDYISQRLILYEKILNTNYDGDFFELVSFSDTPKKDIFLSKKEPLKEELKYFISNRIKPSLDSTKYALNAIKILLD